MTDRHKKAKKLRSLNCSYMYRYTHALLHAIQSYMYMYMYHSPFQLIFGFIKNDFITLHTLQKVSEVTKLCCYQHTVNTRTHKHTEVHIDLQHANFVCLEHHNSTKKMYNIDRFCQSEDTQMGSMHGCSARCLQDCANACLLNEGVFPLRDSLYQRIWLTHYVVFESVYVQGRDMQRRLEGGREKKKE